MQEFSAKCLQDMKLNKYQQDWETGCSPCLSKEFPNFIEYDVWSIVLPLLFISCLEIWLHHNKIDRKHGTLKLHVQEQCGCSAMCVLFDACQIW